MLNAHLIYVKCFMLSFRAEPVEPNSQELRFFYGDFLKHFVFFVDPDILRFTAVVVAEMSQQMFQLAEPTTLWWTPQRTGQHAILENGMPGSGSATMVEHWTPDLEKLGSNAAGLLPTKLLS